MKLAPNVPKTISHSLHVELYINYHRSLSAI